MKISETAVAVPAAAPRVVAGSGQADAVQEKPAAKDKVSIPSPQQNAALEAVRATVASSRAARIAEIISAVQSGQYYPSPQQIAQQLVGDAEVEARLRAMLAR
jgi:anti-sigma28 factor (negative regulator of flagellin synthesis)